jgi:outer membrane protein TolC
MRRIGIGLAMAALLVGGSAEALAQAAGVSWSREDLITRALERSGELVELRQRAERAAAAAGASQYPWNPIFSVELEGSPAPWSGREYTRRLSLEQELDVRGERGARLHAFDAGTAVLREDVRSREQEVAADIDEAVSGWLVARQRLDLLGPALVQARSLGQRAQTARRRELVTAFDERMLRADALEIEGEEIAARRQLEQSEGRLRAWLEPGTDSLRIDESLSTEFWSCEEDSVVTLALLHRGDLARARSAEAQSQARLELANRLGRVNPTIGVSVGQERLEIDAFPQPLEDKDLFVGVHGSIPLPLFQTNKLERMDGQLELDRARSERIAGERQVKGEAAAACAALGRAQERVALLGPLAESARSDLRMLEAAYRDGRAALEQYLTLRERLLRAQRGYVEALGDLEQARNAMVRATGLRRPSLAERLVK